MLRVWACRHCGCPPGSSHGRRRGSPGTFTLSLAGPGRRFSPCSFQHLGCHSGFDVTGPPDLSYSMTRPHLCATSPRDPLRPYLTPSCGPCPGRAPPCWGRGGRDGRGVAAGGGVQPGGKATKACACPLRQSRTLPLRPLSPGELVLRRPCIARPPATWERCLSAPYGV